MTLSYQLEYSAFGYEKAGGGKVKFWGSRKKPGVMDFPLFLPKHAFCLACDPEVWFLLGHLLDVPLALSLLSRYYAFKILVLKSDPATRANVSSFLVLRLNSNTESCVNEIQPRSLEPSSKILCTSTFRLAEQLPGPEVFSYPSKKTFGREDGEAETRLKVSSALKGTSGLTALR